MSKIHVLDQNTINQIAAGEVVERPQAVVKELVENAIDAKSSAITVEIKVGGIDFIRVTDNGSGIDKEDLPNVFLRHSTSKIQSVMDLESVTSLGFRGEALSSISSVAQVELITKTANSLVGIRYQIAGEDIKEPEEIGCPNGTTIIVKNLFFNTPARKKFLKKPNTEAGYISDLMNRLAASHPHISFKFINNNKTRLNTSGNGNLKDIIYSIYGRDIAFDLIDVDVETEDMSMKGFIGKPTVSRGNRNYENYFLNGRYIKSEIITDAIEDAYKPYTMTHRFPFTSLHIQMDSRGVDVNVHPTKLEVRFKNASEIYDFVYNSVKNALGRINHISEVKLVKERDKAKDIQSSPEPFEEKRIDKERKGKPSYYDIARERENYNKASNRDSYKHHTTSVERENTSLLSAEDKENIGQEIKNTEIGKLQEIIQDPSNKIENEIEKNIELEQFSFLSEEAMKEHRIIGQAFSTYWLIEYDEKLYIIDQHAAHEKVLYEKVLYDYKNKKTTSQNLSPPIVITVSMREQEIIEGYQEEFKGLGFEIEEFGGNEYAIRAIPSDLDGLAQRGIFLELVDSLTEESFAGSSEILIDKIASISCKAAVKGNQRLSPREVHVLIDSLLKLENPYYCPHGRPTMISLSKYELEKKFKRV